MQPQSTITFTFQDTSRPGHKLLIITTEGGCTPQDVRECLDAGFSVPGGLYLSWEGTTGVRLYEPIPYDWDQMLKEIEKLLTSKFPKIAINRPTPASVAG